MSLFDDLETIDTRPRPFAFYTAGDLWTDKHTSARNGRSPRSSNRPNVHGDLLTGGP